MDTRSLLYFIAVSEEKHIGRAALRLNLSPSALKRQIRSLEDRVGAPLFSRSSASVEITPAGTALLRHARTIQAELAQAKHNAQHTEPGERTPFDIGVYGSAIFTTIPQLLGRFAGKNPHVELRLHTIRKDQQFTLLRQGMIQLAFNRFLPREADFAYETVHREALWIALHKDHPLAVKDVIELSDLAGEPRVGSTSNRPMETKLSQIFDVSPRVVHRADDVLSALALVSCGLCITFAPPSLRSINVPNVVYRRCAGAPEIPFDLVCMYRKDDGSELLQKMLETVREFRAAHGGEPA